MKERRQKVSSLLRLRPWMKGRPMMISSLLTSSFVTLLALQNPQPETKQELNAEIVLDSNISVWSGKSYEAQWTVGLPLKSKVMEVSIDNELETLRRASDNKERRNPGDKLVIDKAMVQLNAGEEIPAGQEVILNWPKPDHPLVNDNGEQIKAKLAENIIAPNIESLHGNLFNYHFITSDGQEAQLVGISTKGFVGDLVRHQVALDEAEQSGDEEAVKYLSHFIIAESLSGFLLIKEHDSNRINAYPVIGEKADTQINLNPGNSSFAFEHNASALVEILKAYSKKTKTEDELRIEFEPTAENLIQTANDLRQATDAELTKVSGNIQDPANPSRIFSIEASISNSEVFERRDWIENIKLIQMENSNRLNDDRQQMQAIALQIPSEEESSESLPIAGILTEYNPDFPSNQFACGSHVPVLPMIGRSLKDGALEFANLQSFDGPVWNLGYAIFNLSHEVDSYILSWSFMHEDTSYLKKKKIIWGAKAFVNQMTGVHQISTDLP